LNCTFSPSGYQETLAVDIVDISLGGARLNLERMQVGPYHLIVCDEAPQLILEIPLPEAIIRASARICWSRPLEEKRSFALGIEFGHISNEDGEVLKKEINNLSIQ
jgi:hypothetical protein